MPRLLLLRHAKAERAGKGSSGDFDRVLSESGAADAEAIGRVLAERHEAFDRVLCSTSERTRQTWDRLRKALEGPPEPEFLRELYDGQSSYLDIVREKAGEAAALLVIGHNPSIQETAIGLAESFGGADGTALKQRFPTAALAILDFDGGWAGLRPRAARLAAFIRPRESERD